MILKMVAPVFLGLVLFASEGSVLPVPTGPIVLQDFVTCWGMPIPGSYLEGYDTNGNGDYEWVVVGVLRGQEQVTRLPVLVVKYQEPGEQAPEAIWIKAVNGQVRQVTPAAYKDEGKSVCDYLRPFLSLDEA